MSDFLERFLDDYFAECEEHLVAIRRNLLLLEDSVGLPRPDPAVSEELFRSFHSLKGIAGMVEHRETELLAHEMESYLRSVREGDAVLTTHGVEVLIRGAQELEDSIAQRRHNATPLDATVILERLRELTGDERRDQAATGPAAAVAAANWECRFTPSPGLIARGVNVDVVRGRLRAIGDIVSTVPIVTEQGVTFEFRFRGEPDAATLAGFEADGMACRPIESPPAEVVEAAVEHAASRPLLASGHYVRVDLARLDELMRMIGNLVILRSQLTEAVANAEAHLPSAEFRALHDSAHAIERELRGLREGVMRVRLVPVGEIFRRMPFVVRDLARDTGRKVHVVLSGEDTNIDKFVVERMMDPVLHIVRNSVSHGIESAAERLAAGKPAEGTLSLSASAAGETVTIEISDDGRGVDAGRVAARARRAGLAVPAGALDDAALLDLISSPGFSTREQSDRISGRGFGMSVVRETLQELGGSIRMGSRPGLGTTFTIELPLTLAITAALIARVGTQTFAVPQGAVREVAEFDAAAIRGVQGGEVTQFRNQALPLIRLSTVLNIPGGALRSYHAFVVGSGAAAVGLLVDRIVGQREIVVRSTVDPLIRVDGITGATDLGDGRAVLILDAAAIVRQARDGGPRLQQARVRESA